MPEDLQTWKTEVAARLAALRVDPADRAQMIEELAQHLDDRYRSLIARGSSEEAARAAVRQELNDDGLVRDLRRIAPAGSADCGRTRGMPRERCGGHQALRP